MAKEIKITQKTGAGIIDVSERYFRRLLKRFMATGLQGIIPGHLEKPSNDRMADETNRKILNKLQNEYQGFGPTFASEKLAERDGITFSKETVRQIIIDLGLDQPKMRK